MTKHGKSQLAMQSLIDAVLPSQMVHARHHNGSAMHITSKLRYQWS